MTVRLCLPGDLDRVGLIHSRSRQAAYAGLVPPAALAQVTPATQAAHWRDRIAALPAASALLVVLRQDVVVGFASAELASPAGAQLRAMHVLPEAQGAGAGQELMDAVVAAFREWHADRARLHVISGNERAQAFYRRNGWRLVGPAGVHELGGALVDVLEYELLLHPSSHEPQPPADTSAMAVRRLREVGESGRERQR